MSDLAIGRASGAGSPFGATAVALLLAVGILAFVGMIVLGAYAPDWRDGSDGGGHALSRSAIGYSGLVRLADATGRRPQLIRSTTQWKGAALIVATPASGTVDLADLLAARRPILIVLPKWQTAKDERHPGWVDLQDFLPADDPAQMLAPGIRLNVQRHAGGMPLTDAPGVPPAIRFVAPPQLQLIASARSATDGGAQLQPLIVDAEGDIVLGRWIDHDVYLLSDPDLLDNAGMKTPVGAASALALLDWLRGQNAGPIGFDVTLDGLGGTPNPLKLALSPPFLAATLTIAAALLLLGIHALGRFGAPRPRERAIALGKAALVDNSAALVRKARRTHRLGGRYVAVVRDAAVRAFGVPPRLQGAAIDAYLDRLGDAPRFSELAAAVETATDPRTLLTAARALYAWQQEK